ncbi:hypothetical protein RQCS_62440 (plasmid) [Rhodococcus qingshengii]|uniref:hypothetical protein n=1 Tax=Rhodococcus qingshengii TaxID=334542 RepID=UPI0007E54600|nr:hypothetical protein [Rhodococcus qingshengii]BCF86699.1 hypothetical protein RQCS_62440 [Rhodococcus qingshengii]
MSNERGSSPAVQRFRGIPTNEIPAVVPLRLVLAQTDAIAVWISGALVYSSCMTFSIEASVQSTDRFLGMYGFGKPESGHTPPMLLGFEDAQGTLATNLPGRRTGLSANGSGGSGVHNRTGLVLAPVPPPGELQVYFAWPHFGIDETKYVLDAGKFVSAAEHVVTLWDEVDPAAAAQIDINNRTTPEIEIPSAGWFARAFELQKNPPPDPHEPRRVNFAFVRQDSPKD